MVCFVSMYQPLYVYVYRAGIGNGRGHFLRKDDSCDITVLYVPITVCVRV